MAKKNVKQSDIAAKAGVSQSTVSKVLRGAAPENMSPDKKQAVLDAAIELGYTEKKGSELPELQAARAQKAAPSTAPAQPTPSPAVPESPAAPTPAPAAPETPAAPSTAPAAPSTAPAAAAPTQPTESPQDKMISILEQLEKNTRKQLKQQEKNNKLQQATRKMLGNIAFGGAAAVGIPLSFGALLSQFMGVMQTGADASVAGATLGIDPDKLLAMQLRSEAFGVKGFTSSLQSLSKSMYQANRFGDPKLATAAAESGFDAASLDPFIRDEDEAGYIQEIARQYQQGGIGKSALRDLLSRSGLGALMPLFAKGNIGDVLATAPESKGSADAAYELNTLLGVFKTNLSELALTTMPTINSKMKEVITWLDDPENKKKLETFASDAIDTLTTLLHDIAAGIDTALSYIPGYATTPELLEERKDLIKYRESGGYMGLKDVRLKEIDKELVTNRGIDPAELNASSKAIADGAKQTVADNTTRTVEHKGNISVTLSADGMNLSKEDLDKVSNDLQEIFNKNLDEHLEEVKESYK